MTRSRDQASWLTSRLTALGAAVIETPAIRIEPISDQTEINRCIGKISEYDWIIFTSVNGVDHFFAALSANGLDSRSLANAKICVIGPATGDRLIAHTYDLTCSRVASSALQLLKSSLNEMR